VKIPPTYMPADAVLADAPDHGRGHDLARPGGFVAEELQEIAEQRTPFEDDLHALVARGLGPDALDELAQLGFPPGFYAQDVRLAEINEDAISAPAARSVRTWP
jgi:hypothetical protein